MNTVEPTPIPRPAKLLSRIINPLYRLFDWLYSSQYNPLYRSGTLAVGFLAVLLISGLYLSVFYSVSQPFESVRGIQDQIWFGRWIRAIHRYATVAAVISIGFHVLQLLIQGKSWGPRTLAWISGVLLLGMILISAWSGYVMVWDQQGQLIAMSGARLLEIFPFARDLLIQSFNGTAEVNAGFFFMNLFLHVALPLLMIFFLWVHTAKLSRAVWFPARKIFYSSIAALFVLSAVAPVPLLAKADLLKIVGRVPIDIISCIWIPLLINFGTAASWLLMGLIFVFLFAVPFIWRLQKDAERPTSLVDLERCTGCTQCALDCPYEAITMIPRGDGRRLVASVNDANCVSCGICAASCADLAIGPPGRNPIDQCTRATDFFSKSGKGSQKYALTLVACSNNYGLCERLARYAAERKDAVVYPVECCGCVHSGVIETILEYSLGIALIGCPARNCFNRDGLELLAGRVFGKRIPFLDRNIDRQRIFLSAYSEAEMERVVPELEEFSKKIKSVDVAPMSRKRSEWPQQLRAILSSVVLLSCIAGFAQLPVGKPADNATLRFAGSLPSASAEKCRTPGADEQNSLPLHMRQKEICERVPLTYELNIKVNGAPFIHERFGDNNQRLDRQLPINIDQLLEPGAQTIEVSLVGFEHDIEKSRVSCNAKVNILPGEIHLLHYRRDAGQIDCE